MGSVDSPSCSLLILRLTLTISHCFSAQQDIWKSSWVLVFPTKKHAIQTCSVSLRIDINMAQHKTINLNCWVRFFCRTIYFVSRLYSSWAWPWKSHYCAIMPKDWTHLQGNPQALTVNEEPFSAHWCMGTYHLRCTSWGSGITHRGGSHLLTTLTL